MNKFALVVDGCMKTYRFYDSIAEAKPDWQSTIRNSLLCQYDCDIREIDENQQFVRNVSYAEIKKA